MLRCLPTCLMAAVVLQMHVDQGSRIRICRSMVVVIALARRFLLTLLACACIMITVVLLACVPLLHLAVLLIAGTWACRQQLYCMPASACS
jgi:hypothetical protein